MTERVAKPDDQTVARQRRAGDPSASVWVAANAGSGKTYVLTARVLRILLSGVAPEEILCLTFTKAAAAEMRARIAKSLGDWAVMDATRLGEALAALTGGPPGAEELARARTLFAHALETPGGLKINTIHAFCESLLHRFPLEAGVPFNFTVIEDAARTDMIAAAHRAIFADGLAGDHAVSDALDLLFAHLSDHQIEAAVTEALNQMRKLRPVLEDVAAAKARLRSFIAYSGQRAGADVRRDIAAPSLLAPTDIETLVTAFGGDPAKTKSARFVDFLARIADPAHPTAAELVSSFLTGDGDPRKNLLNKDQRAEFPEIQQRLEVERDRVAALHAEFVKLSLIERSEALIDLLAALAADYERRKRASAQLDFDDLIARTIALLSRGADADWVRYKLDAAITHVLVDESQDSNDEQWQVFAGLVAEFFAGAGAVERPRSLFAVGDPKQSIFSFQGAEPELFAATGARYRQQAEAAGKTFHDLQLYASFRSLENLLLAVDRTFENPVLRAAALAETGWQDHRSARTEMGGRAFLWPLEQEEATSFDSTSWPVAETSETQRPAPRRLAENIAGFIRQGIDARRPLPARGRPMRADDVLILVQSRGPLFHEIIRALKTRDLATPGADRLAVTSHIAVRDLLVLADVLMLPADDLGLATLLRSPLFDVGEQELFQLAHTRDGTLFQALGQSDSPAARAAYAELQLWRERLDFERPFEFYADVLYAGGGLKRLHARLGAEVDDVLAEFLDLALAHELGPDPSLQNFVAAMRAHSIIIKRDLGDAGTGVRVMTVHGAKGLEAPIVILADAATGPNKQKMTRPVYFGPSAAPFLVHASAERDHCSETLALRTADTSAQQAEYWRKLYVAMTRAEDELHVAGVLTAKGKPDGSWHQAVATALAPELAVEILPGGVEVEAFPANPPPAKPLTDAADATEAPQAALSLGPAPEPPHRQLLHPSTIEADKPVDPLAPGAEALAGADAARRAGLAVHALLEHLPAIPPDRRPGAAATALDLLLPDAVQDHAAIAADALAILSDPAFAHLFRPQSRAEIAIAADALEEGRPVRITGRIDRLVVTGDEVLIVDFKSDANPPTAIPPAYLTQLALYVLIVEKLFADRPVRAAILWTAGRRLSLAPPADLIDVKARFTFP